MLSITYQVLPAAGGAAVACGVVFESPSSIPQWFPALPPPKHSDPIEVWTPIAGDPNHILYIRGTVSYWHVEAATLGPMFMGDDAPQYEERVRQYPDEQYQWVLQATVRNFERLPRADERYQQQLRATIGDE